MSKEPGRAYEFWNIFVVICETNILYQLRDFLDRRVLLTRKLHNQGFLLVNDLVN
jgi:hypothetical protein